MNMSGVIGVSKKAEGTQRGNQITSWLPFLSIVANKFSSEGVFNSVRTCLRARPWTTATALNTGMQTFGQPHQLIKRLSEPRWFPSNKTVKRWKHPCKWNFHNTMSLSCLSYWPEHNPWNGISGRLVLRIWFLRLLYSPKIPSRLQLQNREYLWERWWSLLYP